MPIEINEQEFKSYLTKTFSKNGLSSYLSLEKVEKFLLLTKIMLEENEKYNLTAITDTKKIILNHYADCVSLASHIKKGASIIDVGCGAGFPTLPLALVRDDIKILAMDSTAKRINYVAETAKALGLSNVTAVAARAEEYSRIADHREGFDIATARAVASLPVLCEICLPFVKVGGKFIAMKASQGLSEAETSKNAANTCGGSIVEIKELSLIGDGDPEKRVVITISKKSRTPDKYPRHYSQISKKPL